VKTRRSTPLTIAMLAALAYFLIPLFWLAVSSTKSTQDLFNTFGLWFSHSPQLLTNIRDTFSTNGGVFIRWILNTVFYAGVSSIGAAFLAAFAGYGFAKYRFRGHKAGFNLVVGTIMVPTTALAIPTYLLFSQVHLVDTPWAVILPSLINPFGLYLMRIYAQDAVPDSLIEAARIDGAGELRIFFTIALRLLGPGLVTVLLFTLVTTWNDLPASVTATTGTSPDGRRVHVVHNWNWNPVRLQAPADLTDVLSDKSVAADSSLRLGAWDARILRS